MPNFISNKFNIFFSENQNILDCAVISVTVNWCWDFSFGKFYHTNFLTSELWSSITLTRCSSTWLSLRDNFGCKARFK
jgi:hypothetical protein